MFEKITKHQMSSTTKRENELIVGIEKRRLWLTLCKSGRITRTHFKQFFVQFVQFLLGCHSNRFRTIFCLRAQKVVPNKNCLKFQPMGLFGALRHKQDDGFGYV
ncbi:UNVERIFIED_CONTAM: hypothetical protein NCL1_25173 [Trichonephila clavipes]